MPSKAIWSIKELFVTKQTIPSRSPSLSVAHRKNLTYASDSEFLLDALDAFAYVLRIRLSITGYLRFLLLSFSFTWPMLYGGFPITTMIDAVFSRSTRLVLASATISVGCCATPPRYSYTSSARERVSAKQMPSKGA